MAAVGGEFRIQGRTPRLKTGLPTSSSCEVVRQHVVAGCNIGDWQGLREGGDKPSPARSPPLDSPSLSKWDISPVGKL